ncbi:hypothetical protein Dsin_008511 [Dipteronia sinensis]|uniref:Uncharacterized protein n=1 Tax=Dipteronia sinensis TaxID=43782 RepID=A0AAE0ANN5_9ROSI|nr:hypothetical protein Dsin_008511 [Dipteronia sinensis]
MARMKKNFITSLFDTKGKSQDTEEGLTKIISDFFSSIFSSSNPSELDILKASKGIKSRMTGIMSEALGSQYSAEEVKDAIFGLSPTKAPGPDGFHAIFFQKAWG